MLVYFSCFITSIIFCFFSQKINRKFLKKFFQFLSVIPFVLVASVRYDVGTDYLYRYVPSYNLLLHNIDVPSLEVGFKLIIKFCQLFTDKPYLMFALCAIISYILLYKIIYKYSKNIYISILMFFIGGYFFLSLNMVRQFLSMIFIMCAFYNFEEGKLKSLIYYVLAILIHKSAAIGIILLIPKYFAKRKIKINIVIILLISILIIFFNNQLSRLIFNIIESATGYSSYLHSDYMGDGFKLLSYLLNFVITIMIFSFSKKKNVESDKIEFETLLYIQLIALLFLSLTSIMPLFNRISYYFQIFQIISLPLVCVKPTNYKKDFLLFIILINLLGLNFTYSYIINNYNEIRPYKTIFERNN